MKKILLILLLFNFMMMPVWSAVVYSSGGMYGLKDDSGKVILRAQYQFVGQMSYTPSKKVIIPMHAMDVARPVKLDLYEIKKGGLWGVANSHGKVIHECKYKSVEADSNGDLQFVLPDGSVEYAHPVMNVAKAARDTLVTVVGLPVTLIGAAMLPIEAISKVGKGK